VRGSGPQGRGDPLLRRHRERSEAISSQLEIASGLRPSQWQGRFGSL